MTSDPCSQAAQCSFFVGPTPGDVLVRMLVEAAVAVFLLVWCLRSRRDGTWAAVGAVAAACWAAVPVLSFVALVSDERGAPDLDTRVTAHQGALDWLGLIGLAVVILAVSVGRSRARVTADT